MSTITAPAATAATTGSRVRTRALGIVGAVAAALVAWGIGALIGADYWITDSMGSARVDITATIGTTVVLGLLGWGVLALAEKVSRHGRTAWTVLAVVVTAASLVPIVLVEATTPTRVGLTLVHLAVAAVLIPAYTRH
ncbi:hypothetical protein Acsp06_10750 [Actinomycetospora sp. NBRC 106375]|uniref:DUF6069 family protein n=1 Tax=Actinomycetospora sp. NBRC 106375 TaxID=3032207 RepID=UPI0024A5BF2B|nr:DUF6069 family protein [Actinomycetospora sp. NBRC 106375]GLZ44890.1 hypothetical protein Acsp06_10750 [Actinomycetospora sp. NBRC 106375]